MSASSACKDSQLRHNAPGGRRDKPHAAAPAGVAAGKAQLVVLTRSTLYNEPCRSRDRGRPFHLGRRGRRKEVGNHHRVDRCRKSVSTIFLVHDVAAHLRGDRSSSGAVPLGRDPGALDSPDLRQCSGTPRERPRPKLAAWPTRSLKCDHARLHTLVSRPADRSPVTTGLSLARCSTRGHGAERKLITAKREISNDYAAENAPFHLVPRTVRIDILRVDHAFERSFGHGCQRLGWR